MYINNVLRNKSYNSDVTQSASMYVNNENNFNTCVNILCVYIVNIN